ncbi:class I SAM-dependent methyltransferase [Desulfosporosinus sp. PR]|uniref:class I SAM-dependent methyltransferase n=1 Tax=Candidatus Desulfosporosinus nitrosoreducens TaxID=3401928 RepID=UPI0027FAEAC2|nr:class I SAM-dependent methyltransferase [Desulfosporosinus sp. PR]MDQ7092722.1 class I SAM-dependent methyltransferase [Desulfosporosinus sp. PR]
MFKDSPILLKATQPDLELCEKIRWFRQQPGCNWADRQDALGTLPELKISRHGVKLMQGPESISFHPNMALIRAINILRGAADRFLTATQLSSGDILIDATLGFGSDALIAALAVGEGGRVLGLEKSPILAALIKDGLQHITQGRSKANTEHKKKAWEALAEAASRIAVYWADHSEFLRSMGSKSVDVVYFDPMFRSTLRQSDSIQPLHKWSEHSPLARETVLEACRTARKRVVLKERKNSGEFERLGFKILSGGRYSSIDYGVILV